MKRPIKKITNFEDMFEIALAAANSYDNYLSNDTIVEIVEDTFAGFLAYFIKRKNDTCLVHKSFQTIKAAIIDFLEVYMENTRKILFQCDVNEIDLDDAIRAFLYRYYSVTEFEIGISVREDIDNRVYCAFLGETDINIEIVLLTLVTMINRRFLLGEVLDYDKICFIYNTMENFSKEMYRSMDESLHVRVKEKLPIISYSGKISKEVLEPLSCYSLVFTFSDMFKHYFTTYFITNIRKRELYNETSMKMAEIIDERLISMFNGLKKNLILEDTNCTLACIPGLSLVFIDIVNNLLWSGKLFKSYFPENMKELKKKISIIHEYGHWIEATFKLFYLLSVADLDNIIISFVDAESNK